MTDGLQVRSVTSDDFEQVYPLLATFPGSRRPREEWRRMLFDPPWDSGGPERGYALFDGARAVGFLGTLFSVRQVQGVPHRFCNLSSWVVDDAHRSSSLRLVFPILALKDVTVVNLTPSETAHAIFIGLGFRILEDHQSLTLPHSALDAFAGPTVITDIGGMRRAMEREGGAAVDHVARTPATQLVLRDGIRSGHVVAVSTPWKWGARLAHVIHASDWPLLWAHRSRVAMALGRRLGTVGLRIDGRFAGRPGLLAQRRPMKIPTLFRPGRPDMSPRMIDGLYTELLWPNR